MQNNPNNDLRSQLLRVRLVGIKFSGATDTPQPVGATYILRVCNINGDRYVVSNDVPHCRLRYWDWAKPRNLRVYSLVDHKPLNLIPLHVIQQNREKVYQSLRRRSSSCVFTFDRALQAAAINTIPSRYNHTATPDDLHASYLAQQAWDRLTSHPRSSAPKAPSPSPAPASSPAPAPSPSRPSLFSRFISFLRLRLL